MFALKTTTETDKLQRKLIKDDVNSVAKSLPAVFHGKNSFQQNRAVKQLYSDDRSVTSLKSLPAIKPYKNSEQAIVNTRSLNPIVLQGAFFVQPPSRDIVRGGQTIHGDAELGNKCYAYSVFNALAQVGRTPTLEDVAGNNVDMTQEEVDDWIRTNMGAAAGGSPQKVANKLDATLKFMPAKLKRRTAVRTALDNNFPVSIGVAITRSDKPHDAPANHWIYAKNTTEAAIVAEDQQNTHRGDLEFTFAEGKWTAVSGNFIYTLTDVMIGYQGPEEKAIIQEFY